MQVFSRSNRSVLLQFLLFCKKVTPKNFIITKTQLESRDALFNTSNFALKFRKRNSILRLLRPGPSHRAFGLVILVSRMQKSVTGENNFVKWKRTFWSDRKNELTGESGPPAKVVPNIPVGPNRNGQFHLISNRNFRNFGLNGKRPRSKIVSLCLVLSNFTPFLMPPLHTKLSLEPYQPFLPA